MKLKTFCKPKNTINRTKWRPEEWENVFTNLTSYSMLISKVHKELKKLDLKKKNRFHFYSFMQHCEPQLPV